MNQEEKPVKQEYKYRGKIINLRVDDALLPNGRISKREVVEHPGGVCVAALTEDHCLYLVRQFRYPYGETVLELPAGKREPGEDPEVCGRRELNEETGNVAGNFREMGRLYPTPGYTNEVIYLYLATDLHMAQMNPDEDEFLEVEKMPLSTLKEMVLRGEIPDAKSQVLILKIAALLEAGQL